MGNKALVRLLNGYRCLYLPLYPRAMVSRNWHGYVYEHVVVAEEALGRPLLATEVVHHLDLSRGNNRLENLLVLDNGQHVKLHMWLDRCGFTPVPPMTLRICTVCQRTLQGSHLLYCSLACKKTDRPGPLHPPKAELACRLKTASTMTSVGRYYGVSATTIRRWSRGYGISLL